VNSRSIANIRAVVLAMLLSSLLRVHVPSRPVTAQAERGVWTAIDAAGPLARWDHTLSADPVSGSLFLFGGRDAEGAPLADTWVHAVEENAWTPVEGPAPPPRFGHAMAVDPEARAFYLFGGQADGETFFNDTWRFDLDALTWEEVATSDVRPSPRYGTSAVLDGDGHVLVSHGFTFDGRFDDTWSLDLATGTWTDVSPAPEARPLKRCLHEAVWDAGQNRMLLYAGCSSGVGPCPQGDLWAFDPATRTWTDLTPAASPAARSNPALVRDEVDGAIWLIDGLTETGYAADLWALDLTGGAPVWIETTQGSVVPKPRASHDATVLDGKIYLFGGYGNTGPLADFWVLDGVEDASSQQEQLATKSEWGIAWRSAAPAAA
jgi:N-acetylneuraminic acid mutarotase